MSRKATGIILVFDEAQSAELLVERAEAFDESFSDTLSVHDWPIGKLCLALLSFEEGEFNYISLARKGRRVATSKNRVEFSSFVNLDHLPIEAVKGHIKPDLVRHFVRSSSGVGGSVPPGTWTEILKALLIERPEIEGELHRLESLTKYAGITLRGNATELLIQEREALGISLDIFSGGTSLRKKVLGEWAPDDSSVEDFNEEQMTAQLVRSSQRGSSFLDGISDRYFQEESTIQHDLFSWEGRPDEHLSGVSVFEQGRRRLEVIYANRNALEKTLGVDLIYFNETYNSFVLVQYKLMYERGDEFIYRPDEQLSKELERMDEFHEAHPADSELTSGEEFRLSSDPFLLKLVPNRGLSPSSGELIKGMYLPRIYVKFLLGPNGPVGPRGGRVISYENAPRYLSNTEFGHNVNAGRIGSCGIMSSAISEIVRSYFETGRAIMVARESQPEESEFVS